MPLIFINGNILWHETCFCISEVLMKLMSIWIFSGVEIMGTDDNKYNGHERRVENRRHIEDRRSTMRFNDTLGRRSGVERRLPVH